MKKKPKIGDVIEIPLPDGRKAYGQYIFWGEKMGPLLQIFDLISKDNLELADINDAKPLFPPIITGLFAAIRTGMWRVIGNHPISNWTLAKING